jgi:hypothetical protein
MNFRPGGEWLIFGFDESGKLRQRAYHYGLLVQAASDFQAACIVDYRNPFDPAALLITTPRLFPGELIQSIDATLGTKLPPNLAKLLPSEFRPYWCESVYGRNSQKL